MTDSKLGEVSTRFDTFIYHDNCMDGLTAVGIAVQSQLGVFGLSSHVRTLPATYGTKINHAKLAGKRVCFLDFSVKKDEMLEILKIAQHVTVMDHHITVHDELASIDADNFEYIYYSDLCGAQIAWKHFVGTEEPYFIKLIGDRDLWTKKYKDADILQLALRVEEYDIDAMIPLITQLISLQKSEPTTVSRKTTELIQSGYSYNTYHQYIIHQLASFATKTTLDDGTPVLKVNCPLGFVSDLGSYLYNTNTEDVIWLYYVNGDAIYNSLRVSDSSDYDGGAYAKSKGGGGHTKACGWKETR